MPTLLKELIASRQGLVEEGEDLIAQDKDPDTPALTDDQVARLDGIEGELKAVADEIGGIEIRQASIAERREFIQGVRNDIGTAHPNQRTTLPGAVVSSIEDMKLLLENDPAKGYKTPRAFIQDVLMKSSGQGRKVKNPDALAYLASSNEMFAAVGSDEQGEYADPYGGFLLPEAFSPTLKQIIPEDDPMAGRTTIIPMGAPTIRIPVRVDKDHSSSVSGGLAVSRRPETAATAASRMTLEQLTLTAHMLTGAAHITDELMSDSPISVAALIAASFQQEFTSVIVDERLNGVGVGEFVGAINAGCVVEVAIEDGQVATTLNYENIINMRARAWGYGNAIWLANHDTLPQLMLLNQSVGTGGAVLWQPSAREDHPDLLLGRPLIFTEYAQTLGTPGDIFLGNWAEYLEGVLQPLESAESIHVRFLNHERTLRFSLRNAGAPWWRTALTPKNSTKTLSPFVKLAVRE